MNLVGARLKARFMSQVIHRASQHSFFTVSLPHRINQVYQVCRPPQLLRPLTVFQPEFKCGFSLSLDELRYEQVSEATLDSLSEVLEGLIEDVAALSDSDVLYNSGVLTLQFGSAGTYVINKQSPNKQIWLSSPLSGPKRFDFQDTTWIYKHTGESLHEVLEKELSNIFGIHVDLSQCVYAVAEYDK